MASDEWLDREDNATVLDFCMRWLSPGSDLSLYALDAEEPDVSEYDQLPDVAALAERPKMCLQDGSGADLKKDFTQLFVDQMYAMDMDLVPEAVDLYAALGVEKAPLGLIAPQFEAPTPALRPAVFPPALRELPPPPLELFDLEEASRTTPPSSRRCSTGARAGRTRTCARSSAKARGYAASCRLRRARRRGGADGALADVFREMVRFKKAADDRLGDAALFGARAAFTYPRCFARNRRYESVRREIPTQHVACARSTLAGPRETRARASPRGGIIAFRCRGIAGRTSPRTTSCTRRPGA